MASGRPLALVIEFEDASKTSISFEALPYHLQCELLRQPFASCSLPEDADGKFVLVEWEDGWLEVTRVAEACSGIGRYYVISRPEEVGRLSLRSGDGYPELIEVTRKPSNISRITFLGTFQLSPGSSNREGKKTDSFFQLTEADSALDQAVEDLKRALKEEGIEPSDFHGADWSHRRELYERIRRNMGIVASYRQRDVYDFIAHLIKKGGLASPKDAESDFAGNGDKVEGLSTKDTS